jgi:hypothetical protein
MHRGFRENLGAGREALQYAINAGIRPLADTNNVSDIGWPPMLAAIHSTTTTPANAGSCSVTMQVWWVAVRDCVKPRIPVQDDPKHTGGNKPSRLVPDTKEDNPPRL